MAGNLKTSYDATNFVLTQDYSLKFNQLDVGKPEVVAQYDPDTQEVDVETVTWKRAIMEETAGFKYIGTETNSGAWGSFWISNAALSVRKESTSAISRWIESRRMISAKVNVSTESLACSSALWRATMSNSRSSIEAV